MKRTRSPVSWVGGKGMMVAKLLPLLPPHRIYVEVFGGGASLLFGKHPSPVEVYNDLDSGLVSFFRVIREPDKFEEFYKRLVMIPWSREEWAYCTETWESCEDEIERAVRWFVVARQSFSGLFGNSWSFAFKSSGRGVAQTVSTWLSCIEALPEAASRMLQVQIEHRDWRDIFRLYDSSETLFYLDPPYVTETLSGGRKERLYKHMLTLLDHKELVHVLLSMKGLAVLSGYAHEAYEPLERAGWVRKDFKTVAFIAGGTRARGTLGPGSGKRMNPRVESVWIKLPAWSAFPLFRETD